MTPIAVKNSGYYYFFFLNEVIFCILFAICVVLNIRVFWQKSVIRFFATVFIWLIYSYKMWFDYKRIWISLKKNITITERVAAHKNPVFLTPKNQFYNPYDGGFMKNALEFFIPCSLC